MMNGFRLIIKPDEEEAEAAEVYVEGRIGGHPRQFLLDTGAARTAVLRDDYTATFAAAGQSSSSGVFARSNDDLITVPDIEVGPIAKKQFTLTRTAGTGPPNRDLIGMDLLKEWRLHFRFDQSWVVVEPAGEADASYTFYDLFLDSKAHPYVDVRFPDGAARAVWDTGASITVVDMGFVQRHPACFKETGHSSGVDSTGATQETPMYVMAGVSIGGAAFPPHRVAGVDLSPVNATIDVPMDLILGYSTLSQTNWLMDFPRQRWAIAKGPVPPRG